MGIGKAMVILICFLIAVISMVTIFSIGLHDKSTADVYTNATNTINATSSLVQTTAGTGTNFMMSLILIVAILFFGATIMIFRKK